jgi:hypothetical protein
MSVIAALIILVDIELDFERLDVVLFMVTLM